MTETKVKSQRIDSLKNLVIGYYGPVVSFTRPINSESTVDVITPAVTLKRKDGGGGIFNVNLESQYDQSTYLSPLDTEWFMSPNAGLDPTGLTYTTWRQAVGGNPPDMLNNTMYMHIVSEDRYFEMEFTQWSVGSGGGFAYTRKEIFMGTLQFLLPGYGVGKVLTSDAYGFAHWATAGGGGGSGRIVVARAVADLNGNDPKAITPGGNVDSITIQEGDIFLAISTNDTGWSYAGPYIVGPTGSQRLTNYGVGQGANFISLMVQITDGNVHMGKVFRCAASSEPNITDDGSGDWAQFENISYDPLYDYKFKGEFIMKQKTSHQNLWLGKDAGLNANNSATNNTFLGCQAGRNTSSGQANTYVGQAAGITNQNGFYNTFLGCNSSCASIGQNRQTVIGYNAYSNNNNTTVIGADARASGDGAVVVGKSSEAYNDSVILGQYSTDKNNSSCFVKGHRTHSRRYGEEVRGVDNTSPGGDNAYSYGSNAFWKQTTDGNSYNLNLWNQGSRDFQFTYGWAVISMKYRCVAIHNATGDAKTWIGNLLIKWSGNGTAPIMVGGGPAEEVWGDAGATAWVLTPTPLLNAFTFNVQGEAGKTIRWLVEIDYTEVKQA